MSDPFYKRGPTPPKIFYNYKLAKALGSPEPLSRKGFWPSETLKYKGV
jgi:hypothetical protein